MNLDSDREVKDCITALKTASLEKKQEIKDSLYDNIESTINKHIRRTSWLETLANLTKFLCSVLQIALVVTSFFAGANDNPDLMFACGAGNAVMVALPEFIGFCEKESEKSRQHTQKLAAQLNMGDLVPAV